MSRGQLNFSFSNVKTNYTTEKSIVDTAAKSSEAKIQNVDVDTSTINEVSGQTYDKNEVMDFSTPDTGAQTNPNIDTNQKNTDSFSGQSGSSSAPSGNGTSHTTDNTTTMKDSSKTSNDSGGNINSNASGNSNSSSTSNFSGTRNSNQSNSDNPGMSNSFGSNSKSDSGESAGSSNSSVSSTSFDSKRDDSYASTFNVDPELAAQLKKIGFNEKDINRLMSGKVTYEQLLEEIQKDPERNRKLIEASFLSQLDIEATSIEELNALLDKKKTERENINDQVLNEYLEVNAQYYLMQLLMSNNDLESALQKDMHITVVTYDDGSVMVMSGANEDVKTATDCKVVDLSKYITDDFVEDLKSKLTLKTRKGLFGKEDKQIYVYKSGNEEFRELYNKLTETNTKQWENYKSIKEEKINELDTEIATYEYVRDEINKYVKYHVDDCQKYMVKEDFESKSDYVAGSKEKLKEYIQDSPVEGYSRIVISDEESFALLMECILNGSVKYSSEEFVDPAVGVPYEEKIIIDENGNKYLIKENYIFQNDFYNHFDEWKQYITEDDIKVFNYILNTEGEKAAYEHLVSISDILDDRWLNNKIAKDEDFATEHPVAASVASIFTTPVDGIAAACNSYAAYLNGQKIRRTDVYSAGDVWRAKISGNIYAYYAEEGKIGAAQTWSFLYGTGMSMLDSLSLVGASVLTGGTATPVLSAVLMGSRSYVSTLNDALDRGLNDGQAIALATTAAIAETAMESWSVSHLLNLEDFLTTTSKNLLGKLKSPILQKTGYKLCMTLSQAFVEGEEEIATEILNFVFDELIAGDLSNFSVRVENYMADGKSEEEAFKLAFKDQGKQFFEAFLGGFVSGFCFGFAKSSTFTHKVSKDMARDISNKYEGKEESFIDRVNAIDEANAEAEKRYKEYKKQLADQFKDDLKTRIKDVGQRIANGFSTVMADNAGKVDLDGFKNSNNARINDKVDTKIFEANANNSEYSSMKQVYDVLNAMIKSDDVETRTIAENISNIQNGNITDLFFTNQLSQYNKSAFAHYDRITLGSGSAFILNYYISNQITAHEFGHMLFDVLDYTKPTDYESVKAKTIENLTNNKQVLDNFFKDAIEYRQKFNEEAKSKITTYLQEHPEVLESMAEDIINNKAAIKQLCKEINLVDSKTELILSQFDNKEVDKLKNNLIALLKYRETIKGIYEAQLYDSEMQQIDMITGIIDSIYEGNNPYYDLYVQNGLRYHESSYFSKDALNGFNEQFADYTAIRVYSDDYAVARTFLGNVLGNEWFDMMGSKYTEIANKITSNSIENFKNNPSNTEAANTDSVEQTNTNTSPNVEYKIDFERKTNSNENKYSNRYVVDSSNIMDTINEINNSNNINERILLETANTLVLSDEVIASLPDNVDVLVRGTYIDEYVNSYKKDAGSSMLSKTAYTKEELQAIMVSISEVESGINENWSDRQKALYIYEYLKQNMTYRTPNEVEGPTSNAIRGKTWDTLMGLVNKVSTCNGFSMIYQELLARQGITAYNVHTNQHAWNVVVLDGKSYFVDTIFDMQNYANGKDETTGFGIALDTNQDRYVRKLDTAYIQNLITTGKISGDFAVLTQEEVEKDLKSMGIEQQVLTEKDTNKLKLRDLERIRGLNEFNIDYNQNIDEEIARLRNEIDNVNQNTASKNPEIIDYEKTEEIPVIDYDKTEEIPVIDYDKTEEIPVIDYEKTEEIPIVGNDINNKNQSNISNETKYYHDIYEITNVFNNFVNEYGNYFAFSVFTNHDFDSNKYGFNFGSISDIPDAYIAHWVKNVGMLKSIEDIMTSKYGKETGEKAFNAYLRTGDATYISRISGARKIARLVNPDMRSEYIKIKNNINEFNREQLSIGGIETGKANADNFYSMVGDYNDSTYGVDQACVERFFTYNLDGKKCSYKQAKDIIINAKKNNEVLPHFEKDFNDEYLKYRDYIVGKGFSQYDADIILMSIDDRGACSYASIVNDIFFKFRYHNSHEMFQQTFGYPVFKSNGLNLNSEYLLIDLYLYINDIDNGGALFKNNKIIKNALKENMIDKYGNPIINGKKQVSLSTNREIKYDLINRFLMSKNSSLYLTCETTIINNPSNVLTKKEMDDIINSVKKGLAENKSIHMSIRSDKDYSIVMFPPANSNYSMVSTDTWKEGGGHAVIITGIDPVGFTVTSWGQKYTIPFNCLRNGGGFSIFTTDIMKGDLTK